MRPLLLAVLSCCFLLGTSSAQPASGELGRHVNSDSLSAEAREPDWRPQQKCGLAWPCALGWPDAKRPCRVFPEGASPADPCRLTSTESEERNPHAHDFAVRPDASCWCAGTGQPFYFITPEQLVWCRAR